MRSYFHLIRYPKQSKMGRVPAYIQYDIASWPASVQTKEFLVSPNNRQYESQIHIPAKWTASMGIWLAYNYSRNARYHWTDNFMLII